MSEHHRAAKWKVVRRRVLHRDGWRCAKCGKAGKLAVHHVVAVRDGGTDDDANLISLCRDCHREAHRREATPTEAEWLRHLDGF